MLPPLKIIADYREANSAVVVALQKLPDVELSLQYLSLGDYLVDDRILFERKTLRDLVVSIRDGRMLEQAVRLASSPIRGVVILEGTSADLVDSGMKREAIQGVLITMTLILGVPLLRARDSDETARLMIYTGRQINRIASGALPRHGKRPKGKRRTQLQILQELPNIGPERARRLLEHFGSVEAVLTADADELSEVVGIGTRTAEAIRWIVSEEGGEWLVASD